MLDCCMGVVMWMTLISTTRTTLQSVQSKLSPLLSQALKWTLKKQKNVDTTYNVIQSLTHCLKA